MKSITATDLVFSKESITILMVLSFAQFVIALDYSIVYIALPEIATSLNISSNLSQWIFSSYAVMFSGFLLVGGKLCDRYGAGSVFLISTALFGLASLLGGLADSDTDLLAARAIQGIAAAAMQPAIISLISSRFRDHEKPKALSIWGAVGASGLVFGVMLGGVLSMVSWRIIFLINVPLVIICVAYARVLLVKDDVKHHSEMPIWSSIIGTVCVLALVSLLTLVSEKEMSNDYVLTFASSVFAVFFLLFIATEIFSKKPLINREIRHIKSLRIGCLGSILYMASVGTEFFVLTLLYQDYYSQSALVTGFIFLPMSISIILGNVLAGKLIGKYQDTTVLSLGFLLGGVGIYLIALSIGQVHSIAVYLGLIVSGLGHGIIYTSKFSVGIKDVEPENEGVASSLMVTAQYASGAIAVALVMIVLQYFEGEQAYNYAFGLLILFCVLGCALKVLDSKDGRNDRS